MAKLFEDSRHYIQDDPLIVELLGPPAKQAQMRYHRRSPSFYRIGRKVVYAGYDLNIWAEANRVETGCEVCQ